MKIVAASFFLLSAASSYLAARYAIAAPFVFAIVFAAYGVGMSARKGLDPLNDVPNAFRVFLASLGGYLVTMAGTFVLPSAGISLLFSSVYLNDEFQRRSLDAIRKGKKGGSVALLGIDGSGKSTHSEATRRWLGERGYAVTLMPFHRYLFVERLAALSAAVRGPTGRRRGNPLRPLVSLVDNLVLQMSSSLGCRLEGRVVIYDRYIWSTYVKYEALGYPVGPISSLYLLPRPYFAMVLDVPVEKSLKVIDERAAHIRYASAVLERERRRYLGIASEHGYPVIDSTSSFEEVQSLIESHLERLFPVVRPGGRP